MKQDIDFIKDIGETLDFCLHNVNSSDIDHLIPVTFFGGQFGQEYPGQFT